MLAKLRFGNGQILLEPRTTPTGLSLAVSTRQPPDSPAQELGVGPAQKLIGRLESWLQNQASIETIDEIDGVLYGNIFNLEGHYATYVTTTGNMRLLIQDKELKIILCAELSDDEVKQWRTEINALSEAIRQESEHS